MLRGIGRAALAAVSVAAGVALGLSLATAPSWAARTRVLRTETPEALAKATGEGTTFSEDGVIGLGPAVEQLADPGVRTIWALARVPGKLVAATGDQGRVLQVDPGSSKAEPVELASLFDYEVFALASDSRGGIFASGAPNGTVSRVAAGSEPVTMFDLPEGVVFSLLADGDGGVYAGTGEQGRLYHIPRSGSAKVVAESPDQTVRTLARGSDGRLWAGTDGRGLVAEIDVRSGEVKVRYDAVEQEIVSILPLADGSLVFGANPGPSAGGAEPSGSAGGPSSPGSPAEAGRDPGAAGPAVYRMAAGGSVRLLWRCPQKLIHALALAPGGDVYVATGDEAAIYRIGANGRATLLWKPQEDRVLALLAEEDVLYAGTSSPGRIYRIGPDPAPRGRLTSEVLDARDQATWGLLRWVGEENGGKISFETRSGYTNPPDPSWDDWKPVQQGDDGGMAVSRPGRFVQWRATLERSGSRVPELRRVHLSYISANAAPRILNLRVSPEEPLFTSQDPTRGAGFTQLLPGGAQIDYSLPMGGTMVVSADDVPLWIRRIRSVLWEAQDADGDDLSYRLEIRAAGEESFRLLTQDLQDRAWSIEATTIPDGRYEIRLTASDAPSNPPGTELSDSRISPPFTVDTVAPVLRDLRARRSGEGAIEVSGTAVDASSPLRRIEVCVDGGAFRWLSPDDGLMDGSTESFRGIIPLTPEQEGAWIVVRAQDEAGNRGSYRAWLEP